MFKRRVCAFTFGMLVSLGGLVIAAQIALAGTSPALIAYDDDSAGVFEVPVGSAGTAAALVAPAGVFPQFSPSGAELAYEQEHAGAINWLVVARRNGARAHKVLTGPYSWDGVAGSIEYPLAWSPAGNELAYGCDGTQNVQPNEPQLTSLQRAQVCVVDVLTGAHHMITDPATNRSPLFESGPMSRMSFTPDDKAIIATVLDESACPPASSYAGEICGHPAVGSIDVDTGAVKLLTRTDQAWAPALSPNGKQILFWQEGSKSDAVPYGIQVMNVNGGDQHQVINALDTTYLNGNIYQAAIWAPNGKSFAYTGYSTENESDLEPFELPISGHGKPSMLFDASTNVYSPVWTPTLTTCTVPSLKGKTVTEAKTLLRRAACSLGKVKGPKSHQGRRKVVSQSPRPKLDRTAGAKVNVTVK